jgi:hypothetical protein
MPATISSWGLEEPRDWAADKAAALDADPDTGRETRKELGIDDNYFTAVAPDPTDEEAEQLLEELIGLTSDARQHE